MDQVTMTILMLVVCFGLMYFLTIRPQKKKEEELKQMMETLEVGDSVLTTSGFYGVVVDKVDETTIIVEFGNDKHCRIPMEKSAIQAMEKATASSSEEYVEYLINRKESETENSICISDSFFVS